MSSNKEIIDKCKGMIDNSSLKTLTVTERYLTLANKELIKRYNKTAKGSGRGFLFGDTDILHYWFSIKNHFELKWGLFVPRNKPIVKTLSNHKARGRIL